MFIFTLVTGLKLPLKAKIFFLYKTAAGKMLFPSGPNITASVIPFLTNCKLIKRLSNLKAEGEIDERDFLDRAELLCSLGQTVMISNFQEYFKVVEYFSDYTKARMGLAMGVNNLVDIFDEKYYRHLSGGILEAFGVWGPKKFMGKEYDGIHRTTFVIDENGILTDVIEKVKTKEHASQILV